MGATQIDGGEYDEINGGLGADTMIGGDDFGAGDTAYWVDNPGDVIIDDVGFDWVNATISWTLGPTIEDLFLWDGAINGTGNGLANSIAGNSASNTLVGLGGDDVLDGALGADTLIAGTGNDTYVVDEGGDPVVENDCEGTGTAASPLVAW